MTHCFSRRSFLKGSAAAAAVLSSPLLPADAASSETENGLFSPVSALCQTQYGPVRGREGKNGLLCWYGIPYSPALCASGRAPAALSSGFHPWGRPTSTPLSPSAPRTA